MPSASFVHSARTDRPLDEVWRALQDEETWAEIGPVDRVWDPVVIDGKLRSFVWRTTVGATSYTGSATVRTSEPNRRMRLELDAKEIAGMLTTDLDASTGDGTMLTVTLEVSARGMLSALFFPVVAQAIGGGLPGQVDRFAASL